MDQLPLKLTDKQSQAFRTINRKDTKALLYGGAKGGAKTVFLCVWFFMFCLWAIKKYGLKASENPPHIAWFGRKQACDFTLTTLQTWYMTIPSERYVVKGATEKHPKHILIDNAVALDYGGLDDKKEIRKFNSAEYGAIGVEQAEEVTKDDVSVLRGTLRLKINGMELPYKEIYTANPRQCWLKDDFITLPKPRHRFIQALPSDNPHLPDSYVDTLKDAFSHRPELLEAYLHGSWDALEGADQIIKSQWLTEASARTIVGWAKRPRICVDTARFGDDETVIYYAEISDILEQWILPYCNIAQLTQKLAIIATQKKCPVVVESTGGDLGAAVIDGLTALRIATVTYNPQGQAIDKRYYNMRAEVWDYSAKALGRGETEFKCKCMSENDLITLRNQLCTPCYKFRNGKTLVEAKADIKSRTGRSPDRGDCWVITQWSYDKVPALKEDEVNWTDDEEDMELAKSYGMKTAI